MEDFVEKIDEQIQDDNKIVTYKSLSFSLALPIQKSKEVLSEYFEVRKSSLKACYILTGQTKCGIKIKLAHDEKVDEEKSKFEKLFSSHIYSVQKTKMKTCTDLYNADYEMIKSATESNHRYNRIVYGGSKQMTPEEVAASRQKMQDNRKNKDDVLQPTPSSSVKTPTQKSHKAFSLFSPKTSSKKAELESKIKQEVNEEKDSSLKKESSSLNKNEIKKEASDETATTEKSTPKTQDKPSEKRKQSSGKKGKGSKPNMMKFMSSKKTDPFANCSKPIKKEKETPSPKELISKEEANVAEEVDFLDDVLTNLSNSEKTPKSRPRKNNSDEEKVEIEANSPIKEQKKKTAVSQSKKKTPVSPSKKKGSAKRKKEDISRDNDSGSEDERITNKTSKSQTKSRNKSSTTKKTETKNTKKRRIIMESSSESEEAISEKEDEPMEEEQTVVEMTPVKTPVIKVGKKNKKRVLKTNTYMDVDGSMLTEKVYEEVSCSSGDEENKNNVIPPTPEPAKKKAIAFPKPTVNKKSKQSSLTSFFTRK